MARRCRPRHRFSCALLLAGSCGGTASVDALRTHDSAASADAASTARMALHMDQGTLTAEGTATYTLPATSCHYRPPDKASNTGYEGMANLTDPDWVASDGTAADGRHVLFYAYGPMFQGTGQIAAWAYDETEQFITQWWSKASCMGATTDKCEGGTGNLPSSAAFLLNPSASVTRSGYELVNKYAPNSTIRTPVGSMQLVDLNGTYRLKINQCVLDHVYVCAKHDFIPFLKNETGGECADQLFGPAIGMDEDDCEDHSHLCPSWAEEGKCDNQKEYMYTICQASCKVCEPKEGDDMYAFWNVEMPEPAKRQQGSEPSFQQRNVHSLGLKVAGFSACCLVLACLSWRCCCSASSRNRRGSAASTREA